MSSEVQIAVIDQQDTQIVLAVPGVQGATGSEIAAGGTANQVLRKASSTNYDTNWSLVTNAMVDSSAAIAGTKISPNFGSQNVVTTGTSTAASFIPTSSSVPTNGVYLPSANNVAISTNGTGRLFVDASGNVGVGNSAPGSLLTVRSASSPTISVENNTSTGFGAVLFRNGGTNYGLQSRINLKALITDTATGASALTFETSTGDLAAPTERMRLDSSGRLGLGTSSPAAKLEVSVGTNDYTAIANTFGVVGPSSTGLYVGTHYDGSGAGIDIVSRGYSSTMGDFRFISVNGSYASPTTRMVINELGRVGIGVTAPSALLSLYAGANSEYFRGGGNGATTRDLVISASTGANAGDTHTINASGATGQLIFSTASNERARIDSSGRLLVGTSSARSNLGGGTQSARLQIEGASGDTARISQIQNANNANAIQYIFAKSRGTTVGSNTIVQSGDSIGQLSFEGSDGTNFVQAASITGAVDGTPGANDMPGRLVFSVTQDTQSSPTEALRITNDRVRCYNQAAPAAVDTTATLTVGNLKTGIITSSTAAAVTMTLPTGTDTEAGFSGVYTNMTFEWTVINTGATNAVTVQGGTGHTLVGSGAVAAGVSGRFASRRTASNTFVTYRLS